MTYLDAYYAKMRLEDDLGTEIYRHYLDAFIETYPQTVRVQSERFRGHGGTLPGRWSRSWNSPRSSP